MNTTYKVFSWVNCAIDPLWCWDRRSVDLSVKEAVFFVLQQPATYRAITVDVVVIGSAMVFGGISVGAIAAISLLGLMVISNYGKRKSLQKMWVQPADATERIIFQKYKGKSIYEMDKEMLKELLNSLSIKLQRNVSKPWELVRHGNLLRNVEVYEGRTLGYSSIDASLLSSKVCLKITEK